MIDRSIHPFDQGITVKTQEVLRSLPSSLENQFAISGGVSAPVRRLMEQYSSYGQLVLQLSQLKEVYLSDPSRANASAVTTVDIELVKLGKEMKYPNVASWLLYKLIAYQPDLQLNIDLAAKNLSIAAKPVNTWGDLINHGIGKPGYICGRRLYDLCLELAKAQRMVEAVDKIQGLDPWKLTPEDAQAFGVGIPLDTPVAEVLSHPAFQLLDLEEYQRRWSKFENSTHGKWEDYPEGRVEQHTTHSLNLL